MSTPLYGSTCRELSVVNLCQLSADTRVLRTSSIVLIQTICYFVSSATLYWADYRFEASKGRKCWEGVLAVTAFDHSAGSILIITVCGEIDILTNHNCNLERTESLEPFHDDSLETKKEAQTSVHYSSERQILVIISENVLEVREIKFSNSEHVASCIVTRINLQGHAVTLHAFWGDYHHTVLAFSGESSQINICVLQSGPNWAVCNWTQSNQEGDDSSPNNSTDPQQCLEDSSGAKLDGTRSLVALTKHKAWVTALSTTSTSTASPHMNTSTSSSFANSHRVDTGSALEGTNLCASGDASGLLIVWKYVDITALPLPATEMKKKRRKPLRSIITNRSVAEGHEITAITLDPWLNLLWIGDTSGAITGAQISLKSRSLQTTRRLTLFGTLGGPSYLEWQPTTMTTCAGGGGGGVAAASSDAGESIEEGTGTNTGLQQVDEKEAQSGYLRCFSSSCGMLVECALHDGVESVFRVWQDPSLAPSAYMAPLESSNNGKVTADAVANYSGLAVEVCALLSEWNMIAVTGGKSRFIQIWDLYSGALQYSIQMEESFCRTLAAFDDSSVIEKNSSRNSQNSTAAAAAAGGDGAARAEGNNGQTAKAQQSMGVEFAYLAAGYASGKFVMLKIRRRLRSGESRATTAGTVADEEHGTSNNNTNNTNNSNENVNKNAANIAAGEESADDLDSNYNFTTSVHGVDILDAIAHQQEFNRIDSALAQGPASIHGSRLLVPAVGAGAVPAAGVGGSDRGAQGLWWEGDDDLSEASDFSLQQQQNGQGYLGEDGATRLGSDDDSVGSGAPAVDRQVGGGGGGDGGRGGGGGAAAEWRQQQQQQRRRGKRQKRRGTYSHSVEIAPDLGHLPVTDIIFSSQGGFVAVCQIRRFITVFNIGTGSGRECDGGGSGAQRGGLDRISLKVKTEHLSDIRALTPSLLSASEGSTGDLQQLHQSLAAAAARREQQGEQQGEQQHASDSLILILQLQHSVRLLDAIRGTTLSEFDLQTADIPVAVSAAWELPVPVPTTATATSHPTAAAAGNLYDDPPVAMDKANNKYGGEIAGICVAEGLQIYLFGEESGRFYQHQLHDQLQPSLLHLSTHAHSPAVYNVTNAMNSQYLCPQRTFSKLDNLVQGVSVRQLTGFSPLATVWSMRRLVLLRIQLLKNRGTEVLRSSEYYVAPDNVRIVYASALKSSPRARNHRAVVVLSNGHVLTVHL